MAFWENCGVQQNYRSEKYEGQMCIAVKWIIIWKHYEKRRHHDGCKLVKMFFYMQLPPPPLPQPAGFSVTKMKNLQSQLFNKHIHKSVLVVIGDFTDLWKSFLANKVSWAAHCKKIWYYQVQQHMYCSEISCTLDSTNKSLLMYWRPWRICMGRLWKWAFFSIGA